MEPHAHADGSAPLRTTLVVGDMHLKQHLILPLVDAAIEQLGVGRVVFCGDYCDNWGATDELLLDELDRQVAWAKQAQASGIETTFLLGNHDWCYTEAAPEHYTRVRALVDAAILLEQLNPQVATTVGGMLVTHAGLTRAWALKAGIEADDAESAARSLNALGELSLGARLLYACGRARGGFEYPGPLWADRTELLADAAPGIDQIVGHTPRLCAEIETDDAGNTLAFVDTFSTGGREFVGDGSMLLVGEGPGGRALSPVTPAELSLPTWRTLLASR